MNKPIYKPQLMAQIKILILLLSFYLPTSCKAKIQTPLSTQEANIIDANKKIIKLKGLNWFGLETPNHAPGGLHLRDHKSILRQIKQLGYNTIRIPFSLDSLNSSQVQGINYNLGSNKDFTNKSPQQILDLIVREAEKQDLLVLLDCHRLNDERIPELWYGNGYTEKDWLQMWQKLALHYKKQKNIIGADLKNEPHGQATWGSNNSKTDWRLAAEKAGNEIHKINPNWLIVVEGIGGEQDWWGGNLKNVKAYPVRLKMQNKLVYSIHEYGPGVYTKEWFFEKDFPRNLYKRWQNGFYFIVEQKIAPVLIGEFGGKQTDTYSKEGIWQRQFINYLAKKNLSFVYWSLNPDSGDTGGILQDDWISVNEEKQVLLNKLL